MGGIDRRSRQTETTRGEGRTESDVPPHPTMEQWGRRCLLGVKVVEQGGHDRVCDVQLCLHEDAGDVDILVPRKIITSHSLHSLKYTMNLGQNCVIIAVINHEDDRFDHSKANYCSKNINT